MDPSNLFSMLMGVGIVFFIILLAIAVLMLIARWFTYDKAGQPGWAAIIPIYNQLILLKISSMHWAWIFILLAAPIPIIGYLAIWIVFGIICPIRTATNFGQSGGFAVGLILLPVVFWPILGFSKKIQWTGKLEKKDVEVGDEFKEKEAEEKEAPKE